ncbi:hypothetical protein M514_15110 [Trichuris suis]|uniref:Uncharacterized protein n=1 Tax=Trichuris suis TaxID=68888 RepID=A0A085NTB0_9BILA|nr:hypothetical protein M514_15110 [Trichuris suis]
MLSNTGRYALTRGTITFLKSQFNIAPEEGIAFDRWRIKAKPKYSIVLVALGQWFSRGHCRHPEVAATFWGMVEGNGETADGGGIRQGDFIDEL